MSPEVISVLNQLPLHTILMIGIIVLWRDNQKLRDRLDEVKKLTLAQNEEISAIKAQTNGKHSDV